MMHGTINAKLFNGIPWLFLLPHDEVTLTTPLTPITDLRQFGLGVVNRSGVDYGAM